MIIVKVHTPQGQFISEQMNDTEYLSLVNSIKDMNKYDSVIIVPTPKGHTLISTDLAKESLFHFEFID